MLFGACAASCALTCGFKSSLLPVLPADGRHCLTRPKPTVMLGTVRACFPIDSRYLAVAVKRAITPPGFSGRSEMRPRKVLRGNFLFDARAGSTLKEQHAWLEGGLCVPCYLVVGQPSSLSFVPSYRFL